MKLSVHKRKSNGEEYFVLQYHNDDEGFFLWHREGQETLYPLAVLVYPRVSGWLAKINWSDFGSLDRKAILSQVFTVADKSIAVINEGDRITPVHSALWIHCSMIIKKHHKEQQGQKALSLPPGSPLLVIPPVWQVWHKPTVKDFYETGEDLF